MFFIRLPKEWKEGEIAKKLSAAKGDFHVVAPSNLTGAVPPMGPVDKDRLAVAQKFGTKWVQANTSDDWSVEYLVKPAMGKVLGIATYLQDNPHVRFKGFSFSVSVPPSVTVDFEMRNSGESSTPTPLSSEKKSQ